MGRRKHTTTAASALETESKTPETDMVPTRRSLRQQARQAIRTKYTDGSSSDESESEVGDVASYAPPPTSKLQRNKRFLKDAQPPQRKRAENETTAAVLHRLISNRTMKNKGRGTSSGVLKGRGRGGRMTSGYFTTSPFKTLAASPRGRGRTGTTREFSEEQMPELPLKVEITEGQNFGDVPGKSKRGRKRKVDLASSQLFGEALHQSQPLNLTMSGDHAQELQQRKRGRQSAATESVKPRFPFCAICLSKSPPNDYIINYMSCPNEYQRMKRLFAYVYKDLKFPFVPFDLERENVFDYCDLPLCDCCIQLYREIYDCYSQIETARDALKAKIERMVYQIQLSEQNPAVAYQLNSVKNSPESLMNKYCNFRRRFSNYRPGDNRSQRDSNNIVPAQIARVTIYNQVPKRTTGVQTFLSQGDFPATTPKVPDQPPKPTAQSTSGSTTTTTPVVASSATAPTSTTLPVKPTIKVEPGTEAKSAQPKNSSKNEVTTSKTNPPKASGNQTHQKTVSSVQSSTTAQQQKQALPVTQASSSVSINRAPCNSVVTIVKTPGGKGPAIIRKIPPQPFPSNHKNPIINGSQTSSVSKSTPGPSGASAPQKFTKTFIYVPKDEPCDVDNNEVEEVDPFLSGEFVESQPSASDAKERDNAPVPPTVSASSSDVDDQHDLDTNVFRKHKKLRVLPIPTYQGSSKKKSEIESSSDEVNNDADKSDENKKAPEQHASSEVKDKLDKERQSEDGTQPIGEESKSSNSSS